jgi:hypothetical protein
MKRKRPKPEHVPLGIQEGFLKTSGDGMGADLKGPIWVTACINSLNWCERP